MATRIPRGSCSSGSYDSSISLELRVDTVRGGSWLLRCHDCVEVWQEDGCDLYRVREGVWVLHEYPADAALALVSKTVKRDDRVHTKYRLAGKAVQIGDREAAAWLTLHHCELPDDLRGLEQEVYRQVTQIPVALDRAECLVTLLMAASIVSRAKRTLEGCKRKDPTFPKPAVKGGKGRPDEWHWSDIRPWLEKKFNRQLPQYFPADRFLRS